MNIKLRFNKLLLVVVLLFAVMLTGCGGGGGGGDTPTPIPTPPEPTERKNPEIILTADTSVARNNKVDVTIVLGTANDSVNLAGYQLAISFNSQLFSYVPSNNESEVEGFETVSGLYGSQKNVVRIMAVPNEENSNQYVAVGKQDDQELVKLTFQANTTKGNAVFKLAEQTDFANIVVNGESNLANLATNNSVSVTIN